MWRLGLPEVATWHRNEILLAPTEEDDARAEEDGATAEEDDASAEQAGASTERGRR